MYRLVQVDLTTEINVFVRYLGENKKNRSSSMDNMYFNSPVLNPDQPQSRVEGIKKELLSVKFHLLIRQRNSSTERWNRCTTLYPRSAFC